MAKSNNKILDFSSWLDYIDPNYEEIYLIYTLVEEGIKDEFQTRKGDDFLSLIAIPQQRAFLTYQFQPLSLFIANLKAAHKFLSVIREKYGIDTDIHAWYALRHEEEKDKDRLKNGYCD